MSDVPFRSQYPGCVRRLLHPADRAGQPPSSKRKSACRRIELRPTWAFGSTECPQLGLDIKFQISDVRYRIILRCRVILFLSNACHTNPPRALERRRDVLLPEIRAALVDIVQVPCPRRSVLSHDKVPGSVR